MLLTLDSSTIPNQPSQDFTVFFPDSLSVKDGPYELCLVKANLWYSYYNISAAMGNNVIKYTTNTPATRTVTFPDGNYTITQINEYLQAFMVTQGDYAVVAGENVYYIDIEPNYTTIKVTITLSNSYTIDLTQSTFNLLLGWTAAVYNFTGTQSGALPANINNGINTILIHCDAVNGSYQNSVVSDVLYSFVPNVPPGSNMEWIPQTKFIYLPVKIPDFIYRIRMYITDQMNRPINFNGQPVTYLLQLQKKKLSYNPAIKNI